MSSAPIGIFDSGVGGLTVARAVMDQLPHESIIYVGDTANGPYGPLPIAQVRAHAIRVMDSLADQGVKMLVIACNSASAATLRDARERYDVPVVEVIHPAVHRAVRATKNQRIGVIGTEATVSSGAYVDALRANPHVNVEQSACPKFVEFVEAGVTDGAELESTAHEYLDGLVAQQIDTLILGCTHYPLLSGLIQHVVGDDVTLVSSAEETAKNVYSELLEGNLLARSDSTRELTFAATGPAETFEQLLNRFVPVVADVGSA